MPDRSENESDELLLLRASAKRLLETLMEETTDRIYIKDLDSHFVMVSNSMIDHFGVNSREDVIGKTDFDMFTIEHAQQAFDDEQRVMSSGEPMNGLIEKETWPDGRVTWTSSTKTPIHLSSGKIIGLLGISRDISEQVVAQQKLAENERLLREQNERMISDYQSAHRVQEVMIPGRVPTVRGVRCGYIWKPMSAVGGDIICFPRNPRMQLLFFLGDVCGHGITAAFYTVLLKYLADHFAEDYNGDPRSFLDRINSEVVGSFKDGFITGLCGHFENNKEGVTLRVSHAGHREVLVWHHDSREFEVVELGDGTVLGLPQRESSPVADIRLGPGDRFYALTDGMLEACSPKGDEFGMDRLIDTLNSVADLDLDDGLDKVYRMVCAFTGTYDQQDDMSAVAFEVES